MKANTKNNKLRPLKHRVHRHVRSSLVPHKGNQYRPLLVRRYGLLAILFVVFGLQFGTQYVETGSVLGRNATIDTSELLVQTNAERSAQNTAPLVRSELLDTAAQMKARDMLQKQYWSHTAPDGTDPWEWFNAAGYNYAAAGENLAKNFNTAESTTAAWMKSPTHRQNMLDTKYSEVGFANVNGELNGKQVSIVVALYGHPAAGGVAGADTFAPTVASGSLSPVGRFGVSLQALSPVALASIVLTLFTAMIAVLAHTYRNHLPKHLRSTWYRHHGLIKASLLVVVLISTLYLYGGGQI